MVVHAERLRAANYPDQDVDKYIEELARNNGLYPGPDAVAVWDAANSVFEGARAGATPDEQIDLYIDQARLHGRAETGKEASFLIEALAVKPDPRIYMQVFGDSHARAPGNYEAAKLPICVALRPIAQDSPAINFESFLWYCEQAAGGDISKLWAGAEADFADKVAKQALLDAQYAQVSAFSQFAATYAPFGGACISGACVIGWESVGGKVQSTCIGGEAQCIFNGWESNTPEGIVNTRCEKSSCFHGWKSKGDDGTWVAKCSEPDKCLEVGWTLKKGKESYTFTCLPHEDKTDCQMAGYDVAGPDGLAFHCPCGKDGCWKGRGADCGLPEQSEP